MAHPAGQADTALHAGAASVEITPPVGCLLAGGAFGASQAVLSPIRARALALRSGPITLLLVSCDLLGFTQDQARQIRAGIAGQAGLDAASVMLACTHTHGGPITYPLRGWGDPEANYLQGLYEKLLAVASRALRSLQPAGIAMAAGELPGLTVNRTSYGTTTYDTLSAWDVRDCTGGPIAMVVSFACHPVALHATRRITPDFPGDLERAVQQKLGCDVPVLFLLGPCGDVNPTCFAMEPERASREPLLSQRIDESARIGQRLTDRSMELLARVDFSSEIPLGYVARTVPLPLSAEPDADTIGAILRRSEKAMASLDASPGNWDYSHHAAMVDWASARLSGTGPALSAEMPFDIQAFRLGSSAILALPVELFTRPGLAIRDGSGHRPLAIATNTNGSWGYMPTPQAFDHGKYEATTVPRLLDLPPFQPDAASHLTAAALELLGTL